MERLELRQNKRAARSRATHQRATRRWNRVARDSVGRRRLIGVAAGGRCSFEHLEDRIVLSTSVPCGIETVQTHIIDGEPFVLVADPLADDSATIDVAMDGGGASDGPLLPIAELPALDSNPGAPVDLFLDLDGHVEPIWGFFSNVVTPVYDIDGDATTYSETELDRINTAWQMVAEDFRPFNVNVTTVEPAVLAQGVPANQANGVALRVAIGGSWDDWFGSESGGVAYLNSFTNSLANVVYAFTDYIGANFGGTCSHEAGHGFGLYHQSLYDEYGVKIDEYNDGEGSWTPIMGNSYYPASRESTWHNGASSQGSDVYQDDLAILSGSLNGFGYRADDHGDSSAAATRLPADSSLLPGIIETNDDVDVFRISPTTSGDYFFRVDVDSVSPNLDAVLELKDSTGTVIAAAAPENELGAELVGTLTAGEAIDDQFTTRIYLGSPRISISDAEAVEGDGGMTELLFTITRERDPSVEFSVDYATFNDSATATTSAGVASFSRHDVNDTFEMPVSVCAADLDGDGDEDMIHAAWNAATVAWHEYDGAGNFQMHVIDDAVAGVSWIAVADMDGDGDSDVLANVTAWLENDGAGNFTSHEIGSLYSSNCVATADIDRDGDLDILSTSYGDMISWHENSLVNPVPADYEATSGTLTFAAGEMEKTFSVTVFGDADIEPDEAFGVAISSDVAQVIGGHGVGTILNDDQPIVLFEDSFEVGEWNGLWVEDSQNDWFRSTQRATDGAQSAEVDGRATDATLTMANAADLTPFRGVQLTYSSYIESGLDTGEYLALDLFNGVWHNDVAIRRGNVDQENNWHHETINIGEAFLVDNFKIRFRAKMSWSSEDANVDNVRLLAAGLAGPPNELPIANAGGSYSGPEGSDVLLDGSASWDPDGTIAGYAWDFNGDGQYDDAAGAMPPAPTRTCLCSRPSHWAATRRAASQLHEQIFSATNFNRHELLLGRLSPRRVMIDSAEEERFSVSRFDDEALDLAIETAFANGLPRPM